MEMDVDVTKNYFHSDFTEYSLGSLYIYAKFIYIIFKNSYSKVVTFIYISLCLKKPKTREVM